MRKALFLFERLLHIRGGAEFRVLCTLHKIEGKTLCKMTINFFLKVLDKMLDLCYTNNVEKGSGKSLLADEGNRKTSVRVQL